MKKNIRLIVISALLCITGLAVAESFRTPPTIAWNKVTQYVDDRVVSTNTAVTYVLYRQVGTNKVEVGTTTNLFLQDPSAQLRQTYTYTVGAIIGGIESDPSSNVVILTYPPKAVTNPRVQ